MDGGGMAWMMARGHVLLLDVLACGRSAAFWAEAITRDIGPLAALERLPQMRI